MKRAFLILLTLTLLAACAKTSDIEDLQDQIDALKSNQIASIEEQLSNIQASITSLQATDNQLSTLISNIKVDPSASIAELEGLEKNLNDKIDALKKYTDSVLKNDKDWVSTTFATLDQHQAVLADLAGIKQGIKDLDEDIRKEIEESLESSELSMKGWVNEHLSGYYTIAQMDVKLKALEEADASSQSTITKLESDLSIAKAELTEAYSKAITDAITKQNGEITSKIAMDIQNATDRLQKQIDALDDRVSALEGMVQSITIIPEYSDGSVMVSSEGVLTFACVIKPSSAVNGLTIDNFKILTTSTVTKANHIHIIEPSSVAIDEAAGVVEVIADISSSLPFDEGMSLAVALNIKSGIVDCTSSFVQVSIPENSKDTCFKISSIGSTVVSISKRGVPCEADFDCRIGDEDWKPYIIGEEISLCDGEFVQFKNKEQSHLSKSHVKWGSSGYYYDDFYFMHVEGTGNIAVSGNIMSLLDSEMRDVPLNNSEFCRLFGDCTALVDASNLILPAMNLADSCYYHMFEGCTSLTSAPSLPATNIAEACYYSMFEGCTSLSSAPELPALTLKPICYSSMFSGCTSLISAPDLPAMALAEDCYDRMFYNCSSLTLAPELPATTLVSFCYWGMFEGCTSLTMAPELPAVILKPCCYYGMFRGCTSLISAPELPAMTLAPNCYDAMFSGCTSLVVAPELRAETLASACYSSMFSGCTSLTSAPLLTVTTLSESCYSDMFGGCTSLTSAPELPATTLADGCYSDMFYGCTSLVSAPELPVTTLESSCYRYMFGGCTSLTSAPELSATTMKSFCYEGMFSGCTNLVSAPELPATTLESSCYRNMFSGCTSLVSAPELPAITMKLSCYEGMFSGCTRLISAPNLPAQTLADWCYEMMFDGCTSLTSPPELPAMTLKRGCYSYMFQNCTSLTSAPILPATSLVEQCYSDMFRNCSNLKYVKALFTSYSMLSWPTIGWLTNVSSSGTFVKSREATWDNSGVIPSGWTVIVE